ncbi:hypothetical protein [Clostridium swellfunianum]|uniref:hypothetical protein n=1 Tax=Clostridium swellfunianum TaxID=1367462 RepID=UPI00203064FB|nr:hypothetical protein [Clostridium swellfunianum]
MKALDTVSSNVIYNVKNAENKKYGYSDILKLLSLDQNIELLEFKSSLDRSGLVSIDMKYHGSLESLYSTLDRMKRENFFVTIEKIEVQNASESDKDINLTALFMKNI